MKYRATLEFKSSGCAVSNKLIYDPSLKFASLSQNYSVHPLPLSAGGRGVEPLTKFEKRGDLKGPQLLEGGCWERGSDFFQGVQLSHNKLKSEIFNDKKSL